MKDALIAAENGSNGMVPICEIDGLLREAHFIPETRNIDSLFKEMQSQKIHMVIVVDEYGQTAGIVTMEDILEEIVGEIHDEYDENEEEYVKEVGEREYLVEGSLNLDDLNDRLDLDLSSEEYDSLGGFIIERLDRLPEAGDEITTDEGIRMVVEKLDKNRIERVHLYLPEKEETEEEESEKDS